MQDKVGDGARAEPENTRWPRWVETTFIAEACEAGAWTLGRTVYSVWWNSVSSLGLANASLYSSGQLQNVDTNTPWYSPVGGALVCNDQHPMALDAPSNLWSSPGASGSSTLNTASNKIIAGPQSTGSGDAPGRGMLSIADYMRWGSVTFPSTRPCDVQNANPQLNMNLISGLGLTPGDYTGCIDEGLDGAFDIQTDIESSQLEPSRSVYWYGFESHCRNLQWRRVPGITASFNQTTKGSHGLDLSRPGRLVRAAHSRPCESDSRHAISSHIPCERGTLARDRAPSGSVPAVAARLSR
jgi:hypothetical protein